MTTEIETRHEKEGDKLPLYCISFLGYSKKKKAWEADFHYVHAENRVHALQQFKLVYPSRKRFRILDAGLVIGYTIDENGVIHA